MADTKENVVKLSTPVVMAFPSVMVPRAVPGPGGKPSGDPKYSANFVFPTDSGDLALLKAAAAAVARAKWPNRSLAELKFPFTNGDKLADKAAAKSKNGEFQRGKVVLVARSKFEPLLAVATGGRITDYVDEQRPAASKFFYNGVQALARFSFVAYDGVGANPDGVTAYLEKVVSTNKGDRLSGGAPSSEEFADYLGTMTDEDPTKASNADEILF